MRAAFSEALVRFAKKDRRILLLTGDHGYALFDEFRSQCPDQYINAGIAEQNMVGMAAGLARAGFIPFVYGLSAFVPVRVLEQIKIDIAHDELPVVLLGDGAGLVYSSLGTSHQSTEDIALTRVIPNLSVLSPADRFEMSLCMDLALQSGSPVYLRMGKSDRGDVHHALPFARIGELIRVREGRPKGISFLATGSMVKAALKVAEEEYPEASVWSVPSIKPVDERCIAEICGSSSALVTMEEHSCFGGLGSMVAEIAARTTPVRICLIGVQDRFSEFCGSYEYLLHEHGLDDETVKARIRSFASAL